MHAHANTRTRTTTQTQTPPQDTDADTDTNAEAHTHTHTPVDQHSHFHDTDVCEDSVGQGWIAACAEAWAQFVSLMRLSCSRQKATPTLVQNRSAVKIVML